MIIQPRRAPGSDRMLDGNPATTVPLRDPTSVVMDATGNFYVADAADNRIHRVSSSGSITTLAGTGIPGFSGDRGPVSAAPIDTPGGLTLPAHQLRYPLEMPVARDEKQVVLQDESGDPEVVVGDRSSCPLQLHERPGVVLSRFGTREQNMHRRLCQEPVH